MKIRSYLKTAVLLGSVLLCIVSPQLLAGEGQHHWSYEGEEGPDHWGALSDEFKSCSDGLNQSPVDLAGAVNAELPELVFEYYSNPVDEINNGHTIQQNIKPGSFLRVPARDQSFQLKQFHFHSPSEHTVNDKSFAMEMHFVHSNEEGALAVVGVLFEEGEMHEELGKLWSFMPENAGETSQKPIGIEETNLLPPTRDYFAYSGSLTTPPCSEGVKWIVLKTPIEASADQIALFKERMHADNNRPVQPNNARYILD